MTHTYNVTGMTCEGCATRISSALLQLEGIEGVIVSVANNEVTVTMSRHIPVARLQKQLDQTGGNYTISVNGQHNETVETARSWFATYKPVLLIFAYIVAVTSLIEVSSMAFDPMRWMRHFMAGFFLVFSFFKILNLRGFKNSYTMYDVIARRFPAWSYIYAFTELLLGIAFLINFNPLVTLSVTLVVMSVSIIGVLQTVLNKRAIKCACLGDVFNLPMSTVTILEDGLMIVMSAFMLISLVY